MKSALARLGIGGVKPQLRKARQGLEAVLTPEDMRIPQNRLAEIRRDMAWLAMLREQIKAIEKTRLERLQQAPRQGPHAMVLVLARIIGAGVDNADMLVREILSKNSPRICQGLAGRTLRRAQERSPDAVTGSSLQDSQANHNRPYM